MLFLLLRPGAADHCQQKAAQKCRLLHTAPATRHLFLILSSFSSPSLSLSLQILQALWKHREQRKKKKETKEKKKSLTSGSQLNPESSRQPCPRGAGPLAPGRGLSPGGWSPEPSPHSPPPRRLPRAPQPRPAAREEAPLARGKGRKGQREGSGRKETGSYGGKLNWDFPVPGYRDGKG